MPPPTPGVPATGQPVQAEELTLNAMVWPVGKWPEGMAFDGEFLWVAESGQRNLAQINPSSGAVMGRVSSGRLPVGMVANQNTGEVWAEVATDQTLVKFNRAAKGGKFASIPDYPSGIAADGTAIWVLLWVDGSNAQGRVVRYDQRSAAMSKSELLGDAPSRIARAGQWLWVNQAKLDTTHLNLLDPASLTKKQTITLNGFCPEMAASENSVFLGGGRWDVDGLVVRVDPFTMQETARRQLPGEFTYRMTADNEFVVAAGMNGTLWVLAAADLTILRKIRLDYGNFQPSSLLIADGMLLVSTHNGAGENGAILVLKDWVPRLGHP